MARKEVRMEELVEVLYQWHKGRNISHIKHLMRLDRKTIRKYLELAEPYGFFVTMRSGTMCIICSWPAGYKPD